MNKQLAKILFTAKIFVVLVISCTFLACQDKNTMEKIIGTTWIRSFEDDKNGTEAYRPDSYQFPPARGRVGYKFLENNTIEKREIGAADGYVSRTGTWKLTDKTSKEGNPIVEITLAELPSNRQAKEKFTLEFVSISDSIVFVKEGE